MFEINILVYLKKNVSEMGYTSELEISKAVDSCSAWTTFPSIPCSLGGHVTKFRPVEGAPK